MKHPATLRNTRRAIKAAQEFFNREEFHPRRGSAVDHVALALMSKALRVSGAVEQLIRSGFGEEAFGLSRTLVEIAFHLRYIAKGTPERRARRFAEYGAKWKLDFMERVLKYTSTPYTKAQLRTEIPDYKFLVRVSRKFASSHSWSDTRKRRGGARRRAQRGKTSEFWEFDYLLVYFWASQYVHATGPAMEHHAHEGGRAPYRTHAYAEGDVDISGLACLNVVRYLDQILGTALHLLGREYPAKLAVSLEKVGKLISG